MGQVQVLQFRNGFGWFRVSNFLWMLGFSFFSFGFLKHTLNKLFRPIFGEVVTLTLDQLDKLICVFFGTRTHHKLNALARLTNRLYLNTILCNQTVEIDWRVIQHTLSEGFKRVVVWHVEDFNHTRWALGGLLCWINLFWRCRLNDLQWVLLVLRLKNLTWLKNWN